MAQRKRTGKNLGQTVARNLGKGLSTLAARVPVLSRARPATRTRSRTKSSTSPAMAVRRAVGSALSPLAPVMTGRFRLGAKSSTASRTSASRSTGTRATGTRATSTRSTGTRAAGTRATGARSSTKRSATARKTTTRAATTVGRGRSAGSTRSAGSAGRPQGKRERIDTTPGKSGGSRYIRRDSAGHFTKDQTTVGRSLAADRRTAAKTKAAKGSKDRGD
jgi:DNA-binding protein HU-beta